LVTAPWASAHGYSCVVPSGQAGHCHVALAADRTTSNPDPVGKDAARYGNQGWLQLLA